MKPIPTSFSANGFVFEQIERSGDFAIYRRFRQGGGQEHFETIRIKRHNGLKFPGMTEKSEPAEFYPGNESWGRDGFTYPHKEDAVRKFVELTKAPAK